MNAGTAAPRLLLSVEEAAHALSVGRTTLYDLIARREVEAVHIGRRSLLTADSIAEYVERLRTAGDRLRPAARLAGPCEGRLCDESGCESRSLVLCPNLASRATSKMMG